MFSFSGSKTLFSVNIIIYTSTSCQLEFRKNFRANLTYKNTLQKRMKCLLKIYLKNMLRRRHYKTTLVLNSYNSYIWYSLYKMDSSKNYIKNNQLINPNIFIRIKILN